MVARLREILLTSVRLFADETGMPVLDPGRGRTKKGFAWAIARDDRPWGGSEPPAVVFHYAPGRGAKHAQALLGGYTGLLQCDGYTVYKGLAAPDGGEGATLVYCWSQGLSNDPRLPVCIFPDGTRMERPSVRQITEKLGWFKNPSRSEYDLSIYGAGPAGLSAAVYGASEGLKTVVVERLTVGGQAGTSPKIENYLGFPQGISGAELAERARDQADHFGAEILILREGVRGEFVPGRGIGYLADGTKIISRASLCATGIDYRRLNLPNEDRLQGAGVYYGAGASEGLVLHRRPCVHRRRRKLGWSGSASFRTLRCAGHDGCARRLPQEHPIGLLGPADLLITSNRGNVPN